MRQYTPFRSLAFLQRFYNLVRAAHPELERDGKFMTDLLALVDDEVRAAIRAERAGTFPKLDVTFSPK